MNEKKQVRAQHNQHQLYVEDILNLTEESHLEFSILKIPRIVFTKKIPRIANDVSDKFAKKGRMENASYVVKWNLPMY